MKQVVRVTLNQIRNIDEGKPEYETVDINCFDANEKLESLSHKLKEDGFIRVTNREVIPSAAVLKMETGVVWDDSYYSSDNFGF